MNYWLLLAEPGTYGFDHLEKQKRAVWDGIRGSHAQKWMRSMKNGDTALIYHTAPEKAVIGTAQIVSNPYLDPKDPDQKLVVVDVRADERLKAPVPLAEMRLNEKLAEMPFMKIQRIAVSPVQKGEFDEICRMGGTRR